MKVPEGKIIYIKKRKYVEGEMLPPGFYFEMPEMTREDAEKEADEFFRRKK